MRLKYSKIIKVIKYFSTKCFPSFLSHTAINNFEIQNVPVPTQSKLLTDTNVQYPSFIKPDEDRNIGGSLGLDFSK